MSRKIKRIANKVEDQIRREEPAPAPAPLAPPPEQVAPPPPPPAAPAPAPVVAPAPAPVVSEYPKVVNVKGASIMLNAPVNPYWEPPMSAQVFGSYGSHVSDPSNAPPGMPNRSPSGFPLIYPGLHWDAAQQVWAGTPIGPARFHCGESSFDTEAQAMAEAQRILADRAKGPDPGWGQVHERMKNPERPAPAPAPAPAPKPPEPPEEEVPL